MHIADGGRWGKTVDKLRFGDYWQDLDWKTLPLGEICKVRTSNWKTGGILDSEKRQNCFNWRRRRVCPEFIWLSGANKLNVRSTRQMSSLSSFYKWLWSWSLQLHSQVWVSTKWNLSYPKQSPFSLAWKERTKAKKSETRKTSHKDHGRGPPWPGLSPAPITSNQSIMSNIVLVITEMQGWYAY